MTSFLWPATRARRLFREVNERGFDLPLGSVTRDGGVEFRSELAISVWNPSDDTSLYKRIAPGDYAIGLRSFQSGIGYSEIEALVSPAYTVLRPKVGIVHRYYKYLFKSGWFISLLENVAEGIRQGKTIAADDFLDLLIPEPPIADQSQVADYLDRETAHVDALLERNERAINLFAERQSALITSAVCGALTNSPTKSSSGLNWVGEIPTSWSVVPLRALGRARTGLTYDPEDIVEAGHPNAVAVLRAGNIQQGRLDLEDLLHVRSAVPESDWIRRGDIVLCARSGSAALVGKSVHVDQDLKSTTWGAFMTVFRSHHNDYLKWVFSSDLFKAEISRFQTTTINQLTHETLHGLRIPLPPAEERVAISRRLAESAQTSQRLLSKATAVSALLRERRQAVITAAVMGHLSVQVAS